MTRFFSALVIPAISLAATGYFAYYAVWGTRGEMALTRTEARLTLRKQRLASLKGQRERLQHRVHLLEPGSIDPDMVEEEARRQLLETAPGHVAVPRSAQ